MNVSVQTPSMKGQNKQWKSLAHSLAFHVTGGSDITNQQVILHLTTGIFTRKQEFHMVVHKRDLTHK